MRIPAFLSQPPSARSTSIALGLLVALLMAVAGLVLLVDRPGLRAHYFALGDPWEGEPFTSAVGAPRLENASQIAENLRTKVVFSVRWHGWWWVERAGEHAFTLAADDGGYLRIDGASIADTEGLFGEPVTAGRATLDRGFHEIEVGLYQRYGESRLTIDWQAPGSSPEVASAPPLADLYAGRPLLPRRALRALLGGWARPYRQLLGVGLLIAALLLARGFAAAFRGTTDGLRARLAALEGPRLRAAMLLALFLFAFFAVLPYTGSVQGGDDTAYLSAATFNAKAWFYNRYGHVYMLKLFSTFAGGDPVTGVRLWWSFVFATTVAALAVAVHSVGPGLQLRTLAVTLFVLFSQAPLFGLIGAGFADYSAMMFVTAAVAVYLHGTSERRRGPPRHEWHALAIGALTIGAFRSKEVGAVVLLLPLLLLIGGERLDLRRFVRQIAYWAAGLVGALLTLMLLDAWLLGEFLFTFDSDRLATSKKMNFPDGQALRKATQSWFHTIWFARLHEANVSLRNLWLGVCAAALVAGFRVDRRGLRLLHLLPIAYLLALIALYVRMPHPLSSRMLITILPVASLTTALLLRHAGLEEIPWRKLLAPAVLIPAGMAAAVVMLVVVPYRLGTLDAADLLPVDLLRRHGWTADHFTTGVLLPVAFLVAIAVLALVARHRRARVAALVIACLALFGVGFEFNRSSLTKKWARQTGELLLYPWRTFAGQIDASSNPLITLSTDLERFFHMSATTRSSLAQVALRRPDVGVILDAYPSRRADLAIASRYTYESWLQLEPRLAETATIGPQGFLVLVRPRETRAQRPKTAAEPAATVPPYDLEARLEELKTNRDPEARQRLMEWILDRFEGPDRLRSSLRLKTLEGGHLRAVLLAADSWTFGTTPAGLILSNPDEPLLVQPIRLTVHAPDSAYPIQVFVDDGEERRVVRFESGRSVKVKLRPLPRRATRFVTIWADKAWPAKNAADDRLLGVRIRTLPAEYPEP